MSTVKISQLSEITQLNANTANSLFMGVDLPTGITGKFTAHVLAQGLYSNEVLNVGNNAVVLPNVSGQFAGSSDAYVQINHQNLNGNGSADIVITSDLGSDLTNYLDLGLNGSTYNYPDFTFASPLDGYLMMQGNDVEPGGNLVIGTYTTDRDLIVSLGDITSDGHVARFKANGFQLLKKPLFFADGSSQNTAASSVIYTQAAYTKANTVNTYAYSANTWLQANDASTLATAVAAGQANVGSALAAGKVYTDTANTWLQANDTTTLSTAKFYSDTQLGNSVANVNLYIDSSYARANAGNNLASAAYAQANSTATSLTITNSVAQGGFNLATAANNKMQYAYDLANTALVNYDDSAESGVINAAEMSAGGLHVNFEDGFGLTGYVDIDTLGNMVSTGDLTAQDIVANNSIDAASLHVEGTANIYGALEVTGAVTMNATLVLANSNFTATDSAVTIKATANVATPSNDGYMLHISGKQNVASRIVFDSYSANGAAYGLVAGRTARGNVDYPAPVQSGDVLMRISGNGYGTNEFAPLGIARIDFVASENYTNAARGSQIKMYNIENGTNTLVNIATFNANNVTFSGTVEPEKGFAYSPRLPAGNQTALSISFINDSMIKANLVADLTVSFSDYKIGKVVEVWLVNTSGLTRTITHGCSSLNSTVNATTFTMPSTSCAYLKYFSIDGDLANTFVSVDHA